MYRQHLAHYQNEKFYLLKKNVKIVSDNFTLSADEVKINFDNSLYDITELYANGNVDFDSKEFEIKGNGNLLNFKVKNDPKNYIMLPKKYHFKTLNQGISELVEYISCQ